MPAHLFTLSSSLVVTTPRNRFVMVWDVHFCSLREIHYLVIVIGSLYSLSPACSCLSGSRGLLQLDLILKNHINIAPKQSYIAGIRNLL